MHGGERVGYDGLLAVARPPSRLPNGKANPEYQRWYRTTEKGQLQVKKWNQSGCAQAVRKYEKTPKGKAMKHRRLLKKRDRGECIREDQCKCVECGMVFDRTMACLDGFKFLRRNRYNGVCNYCG